MKKFILKVVTGATLIAGLGVCTSCSTKHIQEERVRKFLRISALSSSMNVTDYISIDSIAFKKDETKEKNKFEGRYVIKSLEYDIYNVLINISSEGDSLSYTITSDQGLGKEKYELTFKGNSFTGTKYVYNDIYSSDNIYDFKYETIEHTYSVKGNLDFKKNDVWIETENESKRVYTLKNNKIVQYDVYDPGEEDSTGHIDYTYLKGEETYKAYQIVGEDKIVYEFHRSYFSEKKVKSVNVITYNETLKGREERSEKVYYYDDDGRRTSWYENEYSSDALLKGYKYEVQYDGEVESINIYSYKSYSGEYDNLYGTVEETFNSDGLMTKITKEIISSKKTESEWVYDSNWNFKKTSLETKL